MGGWEGGGEGEGDSEYVCVCVRERDTSAPSPPAGAPPTPPCEESGSEAGSYLRLIDSCITQLKALLGPVTRVKKKKKVKV